MTAKSSQVHTCKKLEFHCDNCVGQNNNNNGYVLFLMESYGRRKVSFTRCDHDCCFGLLKLKVDMSTIISIHILKEFFKQVVSFQVPQFA